MAATLSGERPVWVRRPPLVKGRHMPDPKIARRLLDLIHTHYDARAVLLVVCDREDTVVLHRALDKAQLRRLQRVVERALRDLGEYERSMG